MDIYRELGITHFINAHAPLTRLGGAIMPPQVVQAMVEASRWGAMLSELHYKVGREIARLTRNEAAYISCGASSGITLAIAACMAGTDPELSDRLPDTAGMRNQVVMQACDAGYKCDSAVRCSGAKIVSIGTARGAAEAELEAAIDEATAAVLIVVHNHPGQIPLERVVAIAHRHGVPVIVDAAGAVPPKKNLWRFTRDCGADAVVVSGGKGLRGPQSTGLVLGSRTIVNGCVHHGVPNTRIGRGMKVGKEEIAGIYAAVKLFMEQDERETFAARVRQTDYIASRMADLPGAAVRRISAMQLKITFDTVSQGMSYAAASRWFLESDPAILMESADDGLSLSTAGLDNGDERSIADQLLKFFRNPESRNLRATAP
jgi:L-seryl-tRNA(Ser) seleniumtransferase